MASAVTKWEPSERQQRVLSNAQEGHYNTTIEDWCDRDENIRRDYYRWWRDPAFRAWWNNERDAFIECRLSRVYGRQAAVGCGDVKPNKGEAAAAKLVIERYDPQYSPQTRQRLEGDANLRVIITESIRGGTAQIEGVSTGVVPALPDPRSSILADPGEPVEQTEPEQAAESPGSGEQR